MRPPASSHSYRQRVALPPKRIRAENGTRGIARRRGSTPLASGMAAQGDQVVFSHPPTAIPPTPGCFGFVVPVETGSRASVKPSCDRATRAISADQVTRCDLYRRDNSQVSRCIYRCFAPRNASECLSVHLGVSLVAKDGPVEALDAARPNPHLPEVVNRDRRSTSPDLKVFLHSAHIIASARAKDRQEGSVVEGNRQDTFLVIDHRAVHSWRQVHADRQGPVIEEKDGQVYPVAKIPGESRTLIGPEVPMIGLKRQFFHCADNGGGTTLRPNACACAANQRMVSPVVSDLHHSGVRCHCLTEVEDVIGADGRGLLDEDSVACLGRKASERSMRVVGGRDNDQAMGGQLGDGPFGIRRDEPETVFTSDCGCYVGFPIRYAVQTESLRASGGNRFSLHVVASSKDRHGNAGRPFG